MRCLRCQAENLEGSRYCATCGALLALPTPPPHVADTAAAYRASAEGERRHMTVMFCDLVDSVVLGQRLDPEELHEVVRAYQNACAHVIRRHGGSVARYVGDGLLVYFGYPHAHENDPAHAVQAGLDIVEDLKKLNGELERTRHIRLAVRIGIHCGLVVVGDTGGGDELQVLGHSVNLAARLQGAAAPDTVVISTAMLHLVRGLFLTEGIGPRELKGIADPVGLYRVLRPTGVRNRFEVAAATGLTPFVGREHEIALISDRWEEVTAGRGQSVLLRGEAGLGKSRLVRRLRDRLAHAAGAWIEMHCSPYHQHSALHPLIELLERGLGVRANDGPATKLTALEQALEAAQLPLAELVPIFATLLSLPTPPQYPAVSASAETQRRRTVEVLIAWLLHRSAHGPAVVVVEDLHWVDPSTKEFLALLLDHVPAVPILVLLTSRPTEEPLWPGRSNLSEITLHPLSRQQVGAMVEQIAGGSRLPPDVRRQVVTKTDGVPLFVEELTKAVVESHLPRAATLDAKPALHGGLAIPSTLQDSLMARLDRLGASKDVAQVAAVLGREFSHDLLEAVAPMDGAAVSRGLDELVQAELVYQRGVPPQATYRFKHALVQEAAYQSLLRSRRQEAHARVARVLRDRFPERIANEPEEMARHCCEGGLSSEAVRWYRLAGEHAAGRSAHTEAVAHFTRGLEMLASLPDGAERNRSELSLRVALGPPLIAIRGYGDPEVERIYERARGLCEAIDDAPHLFEAVWGLANYYQSRSELGTAQALAEQLVTIAERAAEVRHVVWAHLQLGATLFWRGVPAVSLQHLEVAMGRHLPGTPRLLPGAPDAGVAAHVYAALVLWILGYPERALAANLAGLSAGRVCGDAFSLALALCFSASLHRLRREPAAVREQAEEAIELATAQDFPLWRGLGRALRGWAVASSGGGAEGLEEIRQGLGQLAITGTEVGATGGLVLLAEAARAAGRHEDAMAAVDAGLAVADLRQQHTSDGELYRLRGEFILAGNGQGSAEQAEQCFGRALQTAREQHAAMFELRAAMSYGQLLRGSGRSSEARALLDGVYGRFSEGFDTPDLRAARAFLAAL